MSSKMKWILGILGVSLALNVFALGLYIGKGARAILPHRERAAPPPPAFNFKRLERNLPKEERKKVRALLGEQRQDLRERHRKLRATEQEIKEIILADTVDMEALERALKEHSARAQEMHEPMRWVLLQMVAQLDVEARKKIVEDMFRGGRDKRFRKGHPPPHHRPSHDRRPPPQEDCVDCTDLF